MLDVRPSNMENLNSYQYLEALKIQILENLKEIPFAPSVQMQDVPSYGLGTFDHTEWQSESEERRQEEGDQATT
jgi:histone deacetylase 1/2